ncbi:type IV pilus modification protein PilV [Hydrogenophilus thermoluteolus]|uniref:Type IV pilus assembly protein PilV n=1 Tax=Hydrogenophilus thermoluteolus TaxID=297 RepID=A0A2Z6DZW5_HYDTE|nr:type IV pilus modification protein PilV [Hydrogenophilus thermoluteolus]BBD77775.1 type IV pilus assembly protein PilV [Hydrogenophilus thermoluteolus]
MKRQRGLGLIEVLIAVLVLAIGLLGVAALQANALKANQSALQRSQATMLAYLMLDAMRANRDAATAGGYNLGTPGSPDTPECNPPSENDLITRDQAYWLGKLKENLGNSACGLIACTATSCTVKVFWDDSRAGGSTTQIIEVTSQL